jgi:hypothetical protein
MEVASMNSTTKRVLATLPLALALLLPASTVTASTIVAAPTLNARWALLSDRGTSVVLVGQYTCGPFPSGVPDRGVIDLSLSQTVGGVEVRGFGFLEPRVCDGTPQWYAAELTVGSGGVFQRGRARWSGSGYIEGPNGVEPVSVPPTAIRVQ